MAPSHNFYTSSPTVVLPPNGPIHHHMPGNYSAQPDITPNPLWHPTPLPSNGPIASTPGSLAGRKRSRGDTDPEDDDEASLADGSIRTPPSDEQENPLGKPLPDSGMLIDDSNDPISQIISEANPGSLGGEQSERESDHAAVTKRPAVTSRKSQRLGSAPSGLDDLAQLVLPPQMRDVTTEPLIDEATRALGISWTRMDSSEALRINQAAYGKWIQNHYPGLKEVNIWFENSAIPGYLVVALNAYNGQHEYYIFSHDLTEARLVTSEPSQLVPRLKMLPALHLAAPGGCIRAETDPIPATAGDKRQEVLDSHGDSVEPHRSNGICSAHAMELD